MPSAFSSDPYGLHPVVSKYHRVEFLVERLLMESMITRRWTPLPTSTTQRIQALLEAIVDKVNEMTDKNDVKVKKELQARLESCLEKWRMTLENTKTPSSWKFPVLEYNSPCERPSPFSAIFEYHVKVDKTVKSNSDGESSGSSFATETLTSDSSSCSLIEENTLKDFEFTWISSKSTTKTASPSKHAIKVDSFPETMSKIKQLLALSPVRADSVDPFNIFSYVATRCRDL